MSLIRLFLAFLNIGLIAFGGGYAALPIIQEIIVKQNGWLTMVEMVDVVTLSQLTPGPIAVNAASFVGTKIAGPLGAIVATTGNILPQSILMLILGSLLLRGEKIVILENMLKALRPGIVGLIAIATVDMIVSSLFQTTKLLPIDPIVLAGLLAGLVLYSKKIDVMKLIVLGAFIGLGLGFIETLL